MFFNQAFAGILPLAGTDIAASWDTLYNFLVWLSIFFFVLIIGAMLVFVVKYHHGKGLKPKYITGNHFLEGVFVVIPTLLLMIIFGWGYVIYHEMVQSPPDAYEIHVIARQWVWQFQYDNGRTTTAQLFVPLNRPVRLIMTSQDVTHSLFIPNFRVKQDVVQGMYTSVWFEARVPGQHQIFCTQYCGTSHSGMLAKLIVLDDAQWKAWLEGRKLPPIPDANEVADGTVPLPGRATAEQDIVATAQAAPMPRPLTMVQQGRNLFASKGCTSCHSIDGTEKAGPSLKGIFGKSVELSDGSGVLRDDNYLRESIVQPGAKIVMGYQPIMPTFQGQVSELEINSLIAYIKSLK